MSIIILVIVMETRVERNKKRKKRRRKRLFKRSAILFAFAMLYFGLKITEKSIKELTGEDEKLYIKLLSEDYSLDYFKKLLNKIYNKVIK